MTGTPVGCFLGTRCSANGLTFGTSTSAMGATFFLIFVVRPGGFLLRFPPVVVVPPRPFVLPCLSQILVESHSRFVIFLFFLSVPNNQLSIVVSSRCAAAPQSSVHRRRHQVLRSLLLPLLLLFILLHAHLINIHVRQYDRERVGEFTSPRLVARSPGCIQQVLHAVAQFIHDSRTARGIGELLRVDL